MFRFLPPFGHKAILKSKHPNSTIKYLQVWSHSTPSTTALGCLQVGHLQCPCNRGTEVLGAHPVLGAAADTHGGQGRAVQVEERGL